MRVTIKPGEIQKSMLKPTRNGFWYFFSVSVCLLVTLNFGKSLQIVRNDRSNFFFLSDLISGAGSSLNSASLSNYEI